ncbi:MAG: response regulator [bacterium]
MRALIVDDEPLARRGVRQLLERETDVEVIGDARNGREAVRLIRASTPDLVFLDVQMPELDGFDVLREIGAERMPHVVFVTAYDEFAVRAFEAHAVDYLVKPLRELRFAEAVMRVREQIRANEAVALSQRLAALIAMTESERQPRSEHARRLVVPTASGDLVLDVEEIDWIEADDYYAAVHIRGRRHLIRESLSSLDGRLDPTQFVRVHRSAIISLARVREFRDAEIVLRDGTRVPVSRRRREQVTLLLRRFAG